MSLRSNHLVTLLRGQRYQFADETRLHALMEDVLLRAAWNLEREVQLSPRDRIDFIVDGDIGIEVKIKGRVGETVEQLTRYAASERIGELILFTTRLQLAAMPLDIDGTPLHVAYLTSY